MQYVLVGPRQGMNIKLAGFFFRNGTTDVPEDAKDAQNLLTQFHNAHPAHLVGKTDAGELFVRGKENPDVRLEFIPAKLVKGKDMELNDVELNAKEPDPGPVLETMRKEDLATMAMQNGLSTDGNKADLIARLRGAAK